jgi:hypothetical protein
LTGGQNVTDSFTVQVTDGVATSSVAASFAITGSNDTPTVTATTATVNYANTALTQTLFTAATADAVDTGQTITGLKFTVTGLDGTSNEKFTVDGTEFSLTNATSGTTSANSVGYSVSVAGSTATVTLTKAAGLSAAQTKTLVEGLAYKYATSGGMTLDHVVTLTQITDSGSDNSVTTLALASTVHDTTAPTAIDLTNGTGGTQAIESQFYILANVGAGKALLPNIAASGDTDIAIITMAVGGAVADTSNDKLLLVGTNTDTISLNTTAQSGTETISGIAIDWSYSTGQVLSISKTGGGAFTSAQTQTIEQALQFQTASAATQGARSFTISHTDLSGNTGTSATETVTVDTIAPISLSTLTVTPSGGTVVANTLNSTNTAIAFAATIGAGEATGGKAEFYVNGTLVGTDSSIASGDTSITYTTSDGTPTSAELQAAILAGGTVSVTLYDAAGNTLSANGPTLTRDVLAPTQTVSATAFSADTGTDGDLNTKTAAQTITATLSAALATNDILYGSTDGGTTYTNISSMVVGTAITWTGATLTSSNSLKFKVSDLAGNTDSVTTVAYVLDTTAPAQTVSATAFSADTGTAGDLNTKTAAQTITATLSAGLATNDILYGSTDGGTTYTNITSMVVGTAITWTGATLTSSNSLKFKVSDLAGNTDSVTTVAYVLDTTAPSATLTTATLLNTSSATVQSTEVGTAYLVKSTVTVTNLASITGAADSVWNQTSISTANSDTSLALTGLADGSYKLYTVDSAGNLSAASANTVTIFTQTAGEATIALGAGYGQLIAPVQVESKWYYHWDLSGNGSATVSGTGTNGVSTNGTNGTTQGEDTANHDFLDGIFTQSIYGTVNSGSDTTETYRYATINGARVALPTDGNPSSSSHFQTSTAIYNPASPGTSEATPGAGSYFATGTAGTAGAGTTTNAGYDDLLAVWDASNATATNSRIEGGNSYVGAPTGWQATAYWSATATASSHAYVNLETGLVFDNLDSRVFYVALQVLAPTTLTAASYSRAVDTFTVTGTAFDSAGNVGDDIKAYLDWSKFGYDTDGNNASDVSFDVSEIASATVVSATQLNIVLQTTKAATLEGLLNFDTTTAAVNGADKVITQKGFTDTVYNPSTQVRDAWQSQDASSLGVTQSLAGQSVIELGGSYGKLIAPVQVEGKWYYYWDNSGNGSSSGLDGFDHNTLDTLFNKDINGITNTTVQNADGNFGTTDTYRYATINGVKVALPTMNGGLTYPQGIGNYQNGTSYTDDGPSSNGTSSSFNELLAIWDAYNGMGTNGTVPGSVVTGTPPGWADSGYLSATPSASGHAAISLYTGSVADITDDNPRLVALQVL